MGEHAIVNVAPVIVTPQEVEATEVERFSRARQLLDEGKSQQAAPLFDELADHGADPRIVPAASFNAGLAWEQAGERERALDRFRLTASRFEALEAGKLACIGAARIDGHLEKWKEQATFADRLLARGDLSPLEELAALAAKTLSLAETNDTEGAARFATKAENRVEELGLGQGGQLPLEVAELRFAVGEIRRARSESIMFVPVPPNFADALERRCQGLLDAQSAYVDAMRSFDPHWAAMSGFRVGELYQRLYRDVIAIPAPRTATDEQKRQLFRGAMRLRYRVLLEKGLKMMDHTVAIERRTQETSAWIDRARQAKRELEQALANERKELAKLPYTEDDLKRALEDLTLKGAK